MTVIGLDPGPEQSAVVVLEDGRVTFAKVMQNEVMKGWLVGNFADRGAPPGYLVLEKVESFGLAVGAEVFSTVFWSGRFAETWEQLRLPWDSIGRRDVKLHLCGNMRAKDTNIRQALIDKFGPGKAKAIGTKANPGPLHGLTGHTFAALAVAVTWAETHDTTEG